MGRFSASSDWFRTVKCGLNAWSLMFKGCSWKLWELVSGPLSLDFLYNLHAPVFLCNIVLTLHKGLLCWWLAWSLVNSLCCSWHGECLADFRHWLTYTAQPATHMHEKKNPTQTHTYPKPNRHELDTRHTHNERLGFWLLQRWQPW